MKIIIFILILLLTITTLGQNDSTKRKTLTVRKEKTVKNKRQQVPFCGKRYKYTKFKTKGKSSKTNSNYLKATSKTYTLSFMSKNCYHKTLYYTKKRKKSKALKYEYNDNIIIIKSKLKLFKNGGFYNQEKDRFEFTVKGETLMFRKI